MNKIIYSIVIFCAFSFGISCSKENNVSIDTTGQPVELSFDALMSETVATKTTYDAENHIGLWKREDMVGVIASYGLVNFTDARMQHFSIEQRNRGGKEFLSSATFTGKLTNCGNRTYTYYAVYPYTAFQSVTNASSVASRLEERQYPDLQSWDGACDMLASKPVTVTSSSVAAENLSLQFTRLFGMLRLRFGTNITGTYGSEIVETISIESANATNKLAGKFTVNLASTDAPDPVMSSTAGEYFKKVTLDYRGKNAPLSSIDAYFILNPGTYSDVTITIKTKDHTITLQRTGLTINRGCVASATVNLKSGDAAVDNTPLLPKNPSALKILTFGHSYVVNSMEYMDELLNNAGVANVTFANFYIANCSLQYYWELVNRKGNTKGGTERINYYKRYHNGTTVTTLTTSKTIIDALCDEPWDVVVFQTNTQQLGYYDDFASYLQNMIGYVKTTCQNENGKTPVLAWHMFWAFGSQSSYVNDCYYGSQILNYEAHVQTAKEIMRNNDIQLIIPTGTAIQSLRQSRLNNPYTGADAYEFCLDGKTWSHVDKMAGCYTVACTWFEFFLKPCFGKTILGNTYIPPTADAGVPVTAENRESFQRAAILACQSPFEIAHLDVISPMDITGTTDQFSDGTEKRGPTESFNFIDNLDW